MSKSEIFKLRVSAEEKAAIEAAAQLAGLSVSDWARSRLLAGPVVATTPPKKKPRGRSKVCDRHERHGYKEPVHGCANCE